MWNKKHLITIDSLSRSELEFILQCASTLEPFSGRGNKLDICKGEILAELFFEPSTRTEKSFQAAMYTLGGDVIVHKDTGSSREKGESKADTIRVMEQYSDILVIRDPEAESVEKYAGIVNVPVINAGDGSNEHPTQALIDMYTIWKNFGSLDSLKIAFVGSMKHYRAAHSLIKAVSKFRNNKVFGICPEGFELPFSISGYSDITTDMRKLDDILAGIGPDVVYVGRIPKEYMKSIDIAQCRYEINKKTLQILPKNSIIMHPLPRVGELSPEIDNDPRVMPFRQVRYGLQTRMAVLALMLGHEDKINEIIANLNNI